MPTIEERFWSKVRKSDGCWEWTGAKWGTNKSRGCFYVKPPNHPAAAHRVSYELHYGPIPPGLNVLHKCDNGICVRPDHLFLGTHLDNMQDMAAKGRANHAHRGESHPMVKLAESDVFVIRGKIQSGQSTNSIAGEYGVHKSTIKSIKAGRNWGWLR